MVEDIKTNDRQVAPPDEAPEESLYNRISSSVQAISSAVSKVAASISLESSTAASSPPGFTLGGLVTAADRGYVKFEHESPAKPSMEPARTMTETLSQVITRGTVAPRDQPPIDGRLPRVEILPWPRPGLEHLLDLSRPENVASGIKEHQEIGEFAFKKIQGFLKDNKSDDAQEYIDKINKELQQQDPPSKFELKMKDFDYPGRDGVGRRKGYPGSKGTELRLIDTTKSDEVNASNDTPNWTLKKEETGWLKLDPEGDSVKPEFPPHEKYESPTKRAERLADQSATEMAEILNAKKDLKLISELLEKSGNIEEMVKRIDGKLQKPLSLSVETIEAERNSIIASLGPRYKLDLKVNGESIQPSVILRPFRERYTDYYRHTMSGFDK